MCKKLLVLALVAVLSPAVLGDIVVDDHFDDGDIETNTTGVGTGFNYWDIGWSGNVTEADSKAILNGPVHGGSRASIASKEGAALGVNICRFEFQGVSFAVGNTGTGTTARDCVGVKGDNAAWDYDEGLPTGFWIQFETDNLVTGQNNGWTGTSVLFYESSTDEKTVLATWEFDTLNWDSGTMDLTPVLNITLDLGPTGYSLTIEGDTISNVTGSLSGTYAAAGITNELTTGYATAYIQSENPGIDILIDQIIITEGASGPELASLPSPADEAEDILRDVTLSWTPGEFADTHNVYLGMNFDDVNEAGTDSPLLIGPGISQNTFSPGRLDFSQTYFWRVDEVNAPPDSTVFKGVIWSFTVEPVAYPIPAANITPTASGQSTGQGPEKTIDGSGLDANDLHSIVAADMWLSTTGDPGSAWIQYEFDKPYKLYEMLIWNYNGDSVLALYGIKEVTIEYSTDSVTWAQANISELTEAPGMAGYAANTTVPFDGADVKYVKVIANNNYGGGTGFFNKYGLSEVRFTYIPVDARKPSPEDGATGVALDSALSWRPGREAAEHQVYISTDQDAVLNGTAPVVTVSQASYGPLSLDLGINYFWRVDEVNNVETPSIRPGDTWSFSTQEYLVVDDFESYNDIPTGEEGSNLVYETWIDGYDNPSVNGSTMGYSEAYQPTMETDIVHGGKQSVPLSYNNTSASLSEVTVDPGELAVGRNWTIGAPDTLVLWFYGDPNNASTEQLYVKLNNSKVLISDIDLTQAAWQSAEIPLADFGINLSNITQLVVGLERTDATGSEGILYMDDIRLYKSAL